MSQQARGHVLLLRPVSRLCRARVGFAVLQLGFLVFYTADSVAQFWTGWSLLVPAFATGLLGGASYISTWSAINKEVAEERRELALAATTVAMNFGILAADVTGLFVQWCLFHHNGIGDQAGGKCPF